MDWKEDIPGAQLAGIAGMGYSLCYILFSVCIYSHDIPMIYISLFLVKPSLAAKAQHLGRRDCLLRRKRDEGGPSGSAQHWNGFGASTWT